MRNTDTNLRKDWMGKVIAILLLCTTVALPSQADLPLKIEDLLTKKNQWRGELGMVYANREQRDISTGEFIQIQIGPTQFISLPTVGGEQQVNSDTLVLTPGLRYGVTLDTELYGRLSLSHTASRSEDAGGGTHSQSDDRFADVWLGINHRFWDDDEHPALLGFLEVAALENVANEGTDNVSGKSWLFGLTTYRAIDPLVLGLTAAYGLNLERRLTNGTDHQPGDFLLLNPSVNFAVNNWVTLTYGLQWRWRQADKFNGQPQGLRTTNTAMSLGLGYSWSQRLTLNFNARTNISGQNNAEIGLTFLYKWDGEMGLENLQSEKEVSDM